MRASSGALRVDTIRDDRGFDALRASWLELERANPDLSVFMTWDWQRLWWKHYGASHELRILVARDQERVVGIVPLYLQRLRLRGIWPLTVLRPIGVGGDTAPDDLDPLWAPGYSERAAQASSAEVSRMPGWTMFVASDLDPDGAWLAAIDARLRDDGFACWPQDPVRITYGELAESWDTFLDGLNRDRRQKLRRYVRKFEQEPGACFSRLDQAERIDRAFDELTRLHRLRWGSRGVEHGFSSAAYLGFHRDIMHALHTSGRLRLYTLECQGQPVAMLYGMRMGDTLFYFQSGFDPAFASLSPGVVLVCAAIRAAIDEGCTRFDMLKGDYGHKKHFFQQTRIKAGFKAVRPGLSALLYRARHRLAAVAHGLERPAMSDSGDDEQDRA